MVLHALFGHILLGEDNGQFLGTVVVVVEEDYNITFLDGTVETTVHISLMNSSVTRLRQDSCIAWTISVATFPSPFLPTNRRQPLHAPQRLSRSIA